MAKSRIRIAACQYFIRPVTTFDQFAEQVGSLVASAADYHADLLVFPEYFTIQLFTLSDTSRPASTLVRDIVPYVPRFVDLLSGLARRYGLYIVAGSIPVAEEAEAVGVAGGDAHDGADEDAGAVVAEADVVTASGSSDTTTSTSVSAWASTLASASASGGGWSREPRIYNRSFLFSPHGDHAWQDKLHMTRWEAEDWDIAKGDRLRVFQTELGPLAINICYDVEFPELARAAARAGCYLLIAPSCTDDRQGYLRVRYCAQARAIENTMYVAHACTVGSLPMVPAVSLNYGSASILTPSDFPFARDGILADGNINQEMLVIGDGNIEKIKEARADGTVLPLRDSVTTDQVTAAMEVVEL